MKKILLVLVVAFSIGKKALACDICGCGVGNDYIGILPDFHKHIFGLRYRQNTLITHLGVKGQHTYLTTQERYDNVEAWGGWNITDRFRLMATVPYSFNARTNQGLTDKKNGVGDLSLQGFYQLIQSRKTLPNRLLVQSLWVGAGLKLATGSYNPGDKIAGADNANLFQLGSGSTDFSLNAMYDIRLQDAGMNISGHYKINTANRHQYQYGNKVNLAAQAYYKFRIMNQLMIAPNAGLQFEQAQTDLDRGIQVSVSGGKLLMATAGMEWALGKVALGANFQTPLSQDLAKGIVKAENRLMFHLSLAL